MAGEYNAKMVRVGWEESLSGTFIRVSPVHNDLRGRDSHPASGEDKGQANRVLLRAGRQRRFNGNNFFTPHLLIPLQHPGG